MKIDLAVWTSLEGYEWQPGSVYSPRELAAYKDEIGALTPSTVHFGGLFLKDGKVVFYRAQIADRMDSCGRGAVYCVMGTLPEEKVTEVDFAAIFNSPEMAIPQKPFPLALDCGEGKVTHNSPLGEHPFDERRFNGVDTFSEIAGWCKEAKGGKLKVRITGTFETPLFIVSYSPRILPKPKVEAINEFPRKSSYSHYNHSERAPQYPYHAPRQRTPLPKEKPEDFTINRKFVHGIIIGTILGFILGFLHGLSF